VHDGWIVAGTSTRLIVWITPLSAWMLMPDRTRAGSRNESLESCSHSSRGLTPPPLAIVSRPAKMTCRGPSLLPATTWYSRTFLIWSTVGAVVIVVSAAASLPGYAPVRSFTRRSNARSFGANTVYVWLVSASTDARPVAVSAWTRMS